MYRVCYINLISYCWLSLFVSVDMSYHLVPFPYPNTALLTLTSLVANCQMFHLTNMSLSNMLHFYMLWGQQYNYIHIVLYCCFLNQLRQKRRRNMHLYYFLIFSPTCLFLNHKKTKQHTTTTTKGILFRPSVFSPPVLECECCYVRLFT